MPRPRRAAERAAAYLLENRVLTPEDALDLGVRLEATHRERAATVTTRVGSAGGFVVKMARPGVQEWSRREIRALRPLADDQEARSVAPELVRADEEAGILVTRLVDSAETFHEFYETHPLLAPVEIAALARALTTLHRIPAALSDTSVEDALPWVLKDSGAPSDAEGDGEWLPFAPGPAVDKAHEGLGRARTRWRPSALVHGDVKWDNLLLVGEASGAEREPAVVLVDWELGGVGDPAWDLATIVQEYLVRQSLDAGVPRVTPSEWDGSARAAVRCLLAEYTRRAAHPAPVLDEALERCAQYVGARMVQTACELAAVESGPGEQAQVAFQLAVDTFQQTAALQAELAAGAEGDVGTTQ